MAYHVHWDEARLAWVDSRDQVTLEIKKIQRRVKNEVLRQLEEQFLESLGQNEVAEFDVDLAELRQMIANVAVSMVDGE